MLRRKKIRLPVNYIYVGNNKTTTMTTIDGTNCSIELVGKSSWTTVPCTVLLANDIIILTTAACTVKLDVHPEGYLIEEVFAQKASENYPMVKSRLNKYVPDEECDGYDSLVSLFVVREEILKEQIATSIDSTASKITKQIEKTFSKLENTGIDISSTISHQCLSLQRSIAKLPKEIVEGMQLPQNKAMKSPIDNAVVATDTLKKKFTDLQSQIVNVTELPTEIKAKIDSDVSDLGQRIDQSCNDICAQLSFNSIQNNFSQMVTKVSKVTSKVKNLSAESQKHISDISHGKIFRLVNSILSRMFF